MFAVFSSSTILAFWLCGLSSHCFSTTTAFVLCVCTLLALWTDALFSWTCSIKTAMANERTFFKWLFFGFHIGAVCLALNVVLCSHSYLCPTRPSAAWCRPGFQEDEALVSSLWAS